LLFDLSVSQSSAARIDRLQRQAASGPDVICLGGGLPDPRFFPKRDLGDAFFRALHRPSDALQYGWPEGELELRDWVAARLRLMGADLDPEHVVITNGAQQAISLTTRALLSPGQTVGMMDESYPGAIEAFRSAGLQLVPWERSASAYYLMPAVGNPGGRRMAPDERAEILRRLEREGPLVIEDDAYAESTFVGRREMPLVVLAPERVIHVGTLSKVLCPGLRVGWIATRHPALARILAEKQQADLQAPSLTQRIVAEYLKGPRFDRHIARVRRGYERKAKALLQAVREALPEFRVTVPHGGFSLWLEHRGPHGLFDDLSLLRAAIRRGVSFDPGRTFRIRDSKQLALRLCYGSVPLDELERGAARLAEALEDVRGATSARLTLAPKGREAP